MGQNNILQASSSKPGVLVSTKLTGVAATNILQASDRETIEISTFTLSNNHSSAVNVTVAVLSSGSSDDGTVTVLPTTSLAAKDVMSLKEVVGGGFLSPGDFVSVTASVANVISVVVTGKSIF